jgi:hypothetical protein
LNKKRAAEEEGRRRTKKEEDDEEDGEEIRDDQKWKMDFGRTIESAGEGGRD